MVSRKDNVDARLYYKIVSGTINHFPLRIKKPCLEESKDIEKILSGFLKEIAFEFAMQDR